MVPLGPLQPHLYRNYPKAIRLDQSARIIWNCSSELMNRLRRQNFVLRRLETTWGAFYYLGNCFIATSPHPTMRFLINWFPFTPNNYLHNFHNTISIWRYMTQATLHCLYVFSKHLINFLMGIYTFCMDWIWIKCSVTGLLVCVARADRLVHCVALKVWCSVRGTCGVVGR